MTTVVVPLSAFLMFTFLFARSADSACRSCADNLSLALLKDIEAISSLVRPRQLLRTFAPIATAHPYSARKFTPHASSACAKY